MADPTAVEIIQTALKDWRFPIASIKDIITIIGIIFAAVVGYFKLVHGRVLNERLTPSVTVNLMKYDDSHWISANVEVENTGIRRVRMMHRECDLIISVVWPMDAEPNAHHESRIDVIGLFEDQQFIEGSDTVGDAASVRVSAVGDVPINEADIVGYKVEFRISEEGTPKNKKGSKNAWSIGKYCFLQDSP